MATPILNITELSAAQVDQYLNVNEGFRDLEDAANNFLSVDLSSGNVTLTAAEYRGYVLFRASGNTVARNLTLQAIKRLVVIDNSAGTATLSIILGSTTLTLSAGEKALYYTDGTANGLAAVGGIDITAFDTDASPDGAADFMLTYDTSAGKHKKVLIENLPFSGGGTSAVGEDKNPVAYLSDIKTSGTDGGTATSGSWFTRALAEESDPDGIVTVSSNQFTLQAGTYDLFAFAVAHDVNNHQVRIRNITDGATSLVGLSQLVAAADTMAQPAFVGGTVTIASAKVFELQHRVNATKTTNGQGAAVSFDESEKYAYVKIVKLTAYEQRFSIGRLTIDFASDANYTLATTAGSEEWKDKFLTFTDTGVVLTAGRDVIFPAENGPEYIFTNDTAQTLTCKLSGQTGVAVAAGEVLRLFNNGTDMEVGVDISATVADDSITNAKLANVATSTIKGRITAATGDPEDLTVAQVQTLIGGSGLNADTVDGLQGATLLAGRKNSIINGNFGTNQREVSGTVTLAAGEYGHDRWKAGASGCTYTFATSANVTTLTITAGSLIQVIEGTNLFSGTYVLSWTGTAQGKIGAGSYSASGVTGTATGGTNLNIEFNTGTLSKVQFEPGSLATDFERRSIGEELEMCKRYYRQFGGNAFHRFGTGKIDAASDLQLAFPPLGDMRVTPTLSSSGNFIIEYGSGSTDTVTSVGINNGGLFAAGSVSTPGNVGNLHANNDTTARIKLDAEL